MIKILDYSKKPITKIGEYATICTDYNNPDKYYAIGKSCINSGHGRTLEYVDVVMEISGYSARVIRELNTLAL